MLHTSTHAKKAIGILLQTDMVLMQIEDSFLEKILNAVFWHIEMLFYNYHVKLGREKRRLFPEHVTMESGFSSSPCLFLSLSMQNVQKNHHM